MTKHKQKINIWPYLLVAPALIIVVAIVFVPLVKAVIMSFQSYDLRRPHEIAFIGLGNYMELFQDPQFWNALWRTLVWVAAGVGFQFVFGFILALLLNQKFRGRGLVRAVSLIPWCTPGVLIGLMWRWIYDGNYGVLNDILTKLHLIDQNIPFPRSAGNRFRGGDRDDHLAGHPVLRADDHGRPAERLPGDVRGGGHRRGHLAPETVPDHDPRRSRTRCL